MDTSDTSSPRWLGSFDIEVYLCELVPWWMRDGPEMALMLARERCTLATGARWLTLFSSGLSLAQFIVGVWVVDTISRPLSPASEKLRVRQWLDRRAKDRAARARSTAVENVPEVVGKL